MKKTWNGIIDPHMTQKYVLARLVGRRLAVLLDKIIFRDAQRSPVIIHGRKH